MRLPVSRSAPIAALVLVSACMGGAGPRLSAAPAYAPNGPQADYPMVIGEPFVVDGVTYTPKDTLNIDQVGYAVAGVEGGEAMTVAHRTLPIPSYAEVTALDTGKTILVRVERRGPMAGKALVELSPGAAARLGIDGSGNAAVRFRRVSPIEADRVLLRSGLPASERIDTPRSLLAVLNRKLDTQEGRARPQVLPAVLPGVAAPAMAANTKPSPVLADKSATKPVTPPPARVELASKVQAKSEPVVSNGHLVVQIGAYGNKANADAAVGKTGAVARPKGNLWIVRMGPFESHSSAQAALAKAHQSGYSDARIQRAN